LQCWTDAVQTVGQGVGEGVIKVDHRPSGVVLGHIVVEVKGRMQHVAIALRPVLRPGVWNTTS
jgi:hypothetical protein